MKATITRLKKVRWHPHFDLKERLKVARIGGRNTIIGKESSDGDLVVFFPAGGKLCDEYLLINRLYTIDPVTGHSVGGFFGKDRVVRKINIKGIWVEGFCASVDTLDYLNVGSYNIGEFNKLGNSLIYE